MDIAVVVKRQIIDGKPQWFYDTADLCEQAVIAEGAHVAVSRRIADAMQDEAEATKLMADAGRREVMIANAVRKVLGDMVAEGLLIPKRLPARTLQQDRLFDESGAMETSDPLIVFLYHLMRDELPLGTVAQAVREATENMTGAATLTNGFLGKYAAFLAAELRGIRRSRMNPDVPASVPEE